MQAVEAAKATNWVEVVRFEGGDEAAPVQTQPFTCNYSEWRIRWHFEPGHWHFVQLHSLFVTTYSAETGALIDEIHEFADGIRTGTHQVSGSGTFYVKISTGYTRELYNQI